MARPTTRDGRKAKPICGARNRSGKHCNRPAGWGTNHPGEGKCKLHGGATQVAHGRYSSIQRPRLRELLERYRQDDDPLDLRPELDLLRALITDYVERYDAQTEALHTWHASFTNGFQVAFADWRAMFAAWVERAGKTGREPDREPPPPPIPTAFEGRPRQVPDMLVVGQFIVQIGTLVERIRKSREVGSISLATLDRVLEQFGAELVAATQEVNLEPVARAELLAAVERRWHGIRLDAGKPGPARLAPGGGPLN